MPELSTEKEFALVAMKQAIAKMSESQLREYALTLAAELYHREIHYQTLIKQNWGL